MQDDDIPGIVRYHTYEVLKQEINNPAIRWAYLPYSMHMAGPREAIQHMIIRKNYGAHTASIEVRHAYYGIIVLVACPGPESFLPSQIGRD
jgi:ATP sulfurylase